MRNSMKKLKCVLAVVGLTIAFGACAAGSASLEVRQGWVRWLPGGLPAAGYLTIVNHGDKPVALINTSPRATHALAALTLTLETMSARIAHDACLTLPLLGGSWDEHAIVSDAALAQPLRIAMERFADFIRARQAEAL